MASNVSKTNNYSFCCSFACSLIELCNKDYNGFALLLPNFYKQFAINLDRMPITKHTKKIIRIFIQDTHFNNLNIAVINMCPLVSYLFMKNV